MSEKQTTTAVSYKTTSTSQKIIPQDTKSKSISNWTENILYARSRNVTFKANMLKPLTKHYAFFDGVSVDQFITSKFISINMISGTFSIGEIVQSLPTFTSGKFSFRLCAPNHLDGPYNNPTKIFTSDLVSFPLAQTYGLSQTTYSESSKSLNIDLNSLANPSEVNFSGYARPSMQVVGTSSGAIAEIVESILVTDETGFLTGSFFIPDPTIQTNPKFNNGTNSFSIINVPNISDRNYLSFVESSYYSSGTTNVTEATNITTRNYTIIPSQTTIEETITNTTSNIITQIPPPVPKPAPPKPTPTAAPTPTPTPAPSKVYNGVAYGYILNTDSYGTVDQNKGAQYISSTGTTEIRPIARIDTPGVERALSDGYTLFGPGSVQAWVDKVCAYVGPDAVSKFKLINCSPVSG